MKRRDLLAAVIGDQEPDDPTAQQDPLAASPFANRVVPTLARTTAGLEPYTGVFGTDQLLHLLRRTTFGPSRRDIDLFKGQTMSQVVDQLLAVPAAETSLPAIYAAATGETTPIGSTWINATTNDNSGGRTASLRAWWVGLMLDQQPSIREKMVLFWHNHFVTATATVADPRFSYRYLDILRRFALANFKDLAREVTIDGAMLRYLNGNRNSASAPDENYARELQELFTIGKGPQVGPGDYTNYTEQDVKAAAKVLTGWRDTKNADGSVAVTTSRFDATKHDVTDKTFSYRYGNTVIKGGSDGMLELNGMLDMIFAEPETARFICRKLYRWFVYYVIDSWTEANIIEPLAGTLRSNSYQILPVLDLLFKSAHFFDPLNIGCVIKNPLDHAIGTCRLFAVSFPNAIDPAQQYGMWNYLVGQATALQQTLGDPPDVSGWHAYYQEPQYHELWINSDTLPKRSAWTTRMVTSGYSTAGAKIVIDPIGYVKTLSNPGDPNVIINEMSQYLFASPATDAQKAFLKNVLIPGLPDYEWTIEWTTYLADPTNTTNLNAVKSKLTALLNFMMQMPEYQLM
jgi:uncharacterized protein (DUF1800 family)